MLDQTIVGWLTGMVALRLRQRTCHDVNYSHYLKRGTHIEYTTFYANALGIIVEENIDDFISIERTWTQKRAGNASW